MSEADTSSTSSRKRRQQIKNQQNNQQQVMTSTVSTADPLKNRGATYQPTHHPYAVAAAAKDNLPIVRTPSKTLERPLGLVFLVYRGKLHTLILPCLS